MSKEKIKTVFQSCIDLGVLCTLLILSFSPFGKSFHPEEMLLNDSLPQPYKPQYMKVLNKLPFKEKEPANHPTIPVEQFFQIEPSDAIDGSKYSQPAVSHKQYLVNINAKVPTSAEVKKIKQNASSNSSNLADFQKHSISLDSESENSSKSLRDLRILGSASDFKVGNAQRDFNKTILDSNTKENNFTDSFTNLLSESSDNVLSYENLSSVLDKSTFKDMPVKKSIKESVLNESSHAEETYSESSNHEFLQPTTLVATESSNEASTHVFINLINFTGTTITFPPIYDVNISSSSPSVENKRLSSGAVAGIVVAVLVCVTLLSSAVIYLLYRKYNGKCSSVVEGKFNSDNCGYLDDSLRSSIYLNNHIELPKESSEEMSSLDNDSFLNSLETMTIQNYWADNSKNTKV